jgi:hypothetical protein
MSTAMLLVTLGVYLVGSALALALVGLVLIRLPPDHFRAPRRAGSARWSVARVLRNAAGVLLIAVGFVLSLPAVPGQGVLTMLAGVLLVDLPGKQRLERRLLARQTVLGRINRLRRWFGRPALEPPPNG